jgi:3-phosphoshikimate 1-carboxyvinyltransferase
MGTDYVVEGDYSASSYFFAIAAICGGCITVRSLNPATLQGDRVFLDALKAMGCDINYRSNGITVERYGDLSGITIDMTSSPDTVQTLSIVAAFARTRTTITGIEHLRMKESDRVKAIVDTLTSLGAHVEVGDNALSIIPGELHGGTIDPQNDHRTAMSLAVFGLGIGNLTIENAQCVSKSFPSFWLELERSGLL